MRPGRSAQSRELDRIPNAVIRRGQRVLDRHHAAVPLREVGDEAIVAVAHRQHIVNDRRGRARPGACGWGSGAGCVRGARIVETREREQTASVDLVMRDEKPKAVSDRAAGMTQGIGHQDA
jgi:hypothetical protein